MEPQDKGQGTPQTNYRRAPNYDLDNLDTGGGELTIKQMQFYPLSQLTIIGRDKFQELSQRSSLDN